MYAFGGRAVLAPAPQTFNIPHASLTLSHQLKKVDGEAGDGGREILSLLFQRAGKTTM